MWRSRSNEALIVKPYVMLTDTIDRVIAELDPFFVRAGKYALVTSGLRDAESQLHLIQRFAHTYKLVEEFPEIRVADLRAKMTWKDGSSVYTWQPCWSGLLRDGCIINPPLPAVCLFTSIRPNGTDRKGQLIQATPHRLGKSFDIGGGVVGVDAILAVIHEAALESVAGCTVERHPLQRCVHVDCR